MQLKHQVLKLQIKTVRNDFHFKYFLRKMNNTQATYKIIESINYGNKLK